MILPIIQAPDERLRQTAFEVVGECQQQIENLRDTFAATQGCIGLAANQLGIPLRMIIVDVTQSRSQPLLMINPKLVSWSVDLQAVNDGCMSVGYGKPRAMTKRPKRVRAIWRDEEGFEHTMKFTGLMAACVHHEIQHLDGLLYTDLIEEKPRARIAATV